MRVFRLVLPAIALVGVLAMAVAFSWFSHHPDHVWLEQTRSWPLIGRASDWLQRTYDRDATGQEASEPADGTALPEIVVIEPDLSRVGARPSTWVEPDMPLRKAPHPDAAVVATFDAYANLPELEERNGWQRVRWHGTEGWIAPRPGAGPLLGREPDPPGPLTSRPADPERLQAARDLLAHRAAQTSPSLASTGAALAHLGPYALLTDTPNQLLLDRLGRMAPELDRLYAERFGRQPLDTPRETVVLFEHEDDYRVLQGLSVSLAGLNAAGHAGWGMVAFYRGERDMDDLSATFVHEIVHLINRRAIGPALPPWLDEGIAEALASAQLLPWGGIEPHAWGGHRRRIGLRIEIAGQRAARRGLQAQIRSDRLPTLRDLLGFDSEAFHRGTEETITHYTMAGTFIRYLLDGDGGRWASGFQGFLDDVANGGEPDGTVLFDHLNTGGETLEAGYRRWLLSFDW